MRSDLQNFPGHGQQRQALDEVRVGVFLVLVLEVPEEHVHVQVLQLGHLLSIADNRLKDEICLRSRKNKLVNYDAPLGPCIRQLP